MERRATPTWYDDAKLGIFVHWGLYSVPGWAVASGTLDEMPEKLGWRAWFRDTAYAEWYANSLKIAGSLTGVHHRANYRSAGYYDFIPAFNEAIKTWDPAEFSDVIKSSGAGYVVLTTKHHDGFRLWPSRVAHPTLGDFHASRDLVGELAQSVRAAGMRFGTYYSGGLDWSVNPAAIEDLPDLGKTVIQDPAYIAYADAHWRELIERYGTAVLWNDIAYPRVSNLTTIVSDFYRHTPDGLVNDRFQDIAADGTHTPLVPPDILTPEYTSFAEIRTDKWETTRGIGFSFGYNQAEDEATFIAIDKLIHLFIDIVSKNGNLLLNVGPRANGSIQEGQIARLQALGAWLAVNGEAIYGTRPWLKAEGVTDGGIPIRFTTKGDALYAIMLGQPAPGPLVLAGLLAESGTTVSLVGEDRALPAKQLGDGIRVVVPEDLPESLAHALRISPPPSQA